MKNCPDFKLTSSRSSKSPQSYGGSPPKLLRIRTLHNLVHTLAAQVKKVSNLTKRLALLPHLHNLGVSRLVRRRARLQWAPLPSRNLLKSSNSVSRQHALFVTLTHIAHPSPDKDFMTINNLSMDSGASGVTLPRSELFDCFDVHIEASVVIHIWHFRTSVYAMREHSKDFSERGKDES